MASRDLGRAVRCKTCTYVPDADEWVCSDCGYRASGALAAVLDRTFAALRALATRDDDLEEVAEFDDDEMGVDPELEEDDD